jgi:hypothetical protein
MGADSRRNGDEAEAFLRQWTIPEEDRALFTTAKWHGEYRWFRSPNVVCLEKYRRLKAMEGGSDP